MEDATGRPLDPYDMELAVHPSGMDNEGAICWLTSVLQALASCTCLRAVALRLRSQAQDPRITPVGHQLINMLACAVVPERAAVQVAAALQQHAAARADGDAALGQQPTMADQCAHEGLVMLLEAAWDDPAAARARALNPADRDNAADLTNPVLRPFLARQRASVYDEDCELLGTPVEEPLTVLDLFHLDAADVRDPLAPRAEGGLYEDGDEAGRARAFAGLLRRRITPLEDCPALPEYGGKAPVHRLYALSVVPEVLVVAYNCFGL